MRKISIRLRKGAGGAIPPYDLETYEELPLAAQLRRLGERYGNNMIAELCVEALDARSREKAKSLNAELADVPAGEREQRFIEGMRQWRPESRRKKDALDLAIESLELELRNLPPEAQGARLTEGLARLEAICKKDLTE